MSRKILYGHHCSRVRWGWIAPAGVLSVDPWALNPRELLAHQQKVLDDLKATQGKVMLIPDTGKTKSQP